MLRVTLVSLLLFAGIAAAKTPVTHESIWLMKRVGAPAPSPDGKWVVVPVTEPAYDDKDVVSDLWIVAADGGAPPRRLTFSKTPENGPAWSPDSRRIAFGAKREGDEASQIYVLDVAGGGEAVRITNLSTGASSPRWSPDGKTLLFASTVYPGAADDDANRKIAAERKARKYKARVFDGFPIRQWDHWLDDTRTHVFVQPAEPGAKARDLLAGTKLAGERGFGGAPTMSGEEPQAVWTPDGQSVVFVATTKRNAAAYAAVNTHLYQIAAANPAEPKQLTSGDDDYFKPSFRPDGKALYCLTSRNSDKVYHVQRVAMFAWPAAGERTLVTAALDRSISTFEFTPDSRRILMLAEEFGHDKLFSAPAGGGASELLYEVPAGSYSNLAIGGGTVVANWDSAINPPEVVRIDTAARRHQALTEFASAQAAEIDWQRLLEFWLTCKGGQRIQSMVALPPGFDKTKKYPLLVVMHGGPHSMWKDQFVLRWNYHLLAKPGYVVLLSNYTGSTGFGEKFAQDIQFDPLKTPANEINESADEAIRLYPFIDATRQAAAGASYGGHLANWMQATTTRYKALVSHAGLINLESQWGTSDMIYHREVNAGGPVWEQGRVWREQNPIRFAKNFRTPILLTVGENDFRVPINQTIENWSVLQRLRIPSRLVVFPDANHWILKGEDSRFFYQEVHAWLAKHLGG